ncbi:MAG: hypothetical protein JRL30_25940 [Deltaproteobacteria bacterium]|nr:hypothetical protein [Deltaproteobacteria bacterium]
MNDEEVTKELTELGVEIPEGATYQEKMKLLKEKKLEAEAAKPADDAPADEPAPEADTPADDKADADTPAPEPVPEPDAPVEDAPADEPEPEEDEEKGERTVKEGDHPFIGNHDMSSGG